MLNLYVKLKDIEIKSISSHELEGVLYCINESKENLKIIGSNKELSMDMLKERYLESLVNPLEFFCGIYKDYELIGIIKGRLENKLVIEAWLLVYIIISKYRNQGLGSKILKGFEEYLKQVFNVSKYHIIVSSDNCKSINFWIKNGYKLERTSTFLKINNKPVKILVKGVI